MEDYSLSLLEILATAVARMGPIPEHIAVIMDGLASRISNFL